MTSPWIISRGQDLLWFWAGAAVSLGAGLLALRWPVLALPLFCAWLLFSDGPHFWATWTRTYFDPLERARRGRLLTTSWLIWAPGFACLAAARLLDAPGIFDAFLAVAAIWGWHHFVRQDYGIWALYARKTGLNAEERREDTFFLYGALWLLFAWFSLAHPLNQASVPFALPAWLAPDLAAALGVFAGAYALKLLLRSRRGRPVTPGLFVLVPNLLFQWIGFQIVGMAEPTIPGFTNTEQAFAVLGIANGITHGMQYLGLVAFAAHNRYPEGGPSLGARMSGRPALGYAVYLLLSVPYVAVNLLREAAPGVHLVGPTAAGIALCVYWGFVLHHYLLDQYIWRPHLDARLRADLGLG